ncbi:alpha/beta hydrolase family protein [Allosphingosinicella deserti]|uniref:alpha/beta hydrolase family protein n=1 Tax=Allosphingosinicella deserti TaxID=2116704 RepID=UPI001304B85A|nr:alpha/beta fold hydrolase [Sphingomonas deserti]
MLALRQFCAKILASLLLLAAAVAPARAETTGALLSREAYAFPFGSRAEWLSFVRGTPGGVAASSAYAALFSDADYKRYKAGTRTRTSRIAYRSGDLSINGFIVEPLSQGPHPILVFNHGGVMQWGRIVLAELLEFNRLAERGYIVVASNFRGEGGSQGTPSMDGGDVDDVMALVELASSLPNADPKRIGMWGFSRGGLVTYGILARTNRIAAAVITGGPTDLVNAPRRAEFDEHVYPHVIRDYAADKDRALARLSPIHWPERLSPATSILLLHGGDDPRVAPSDSIRMAAELQRLQRAYRLLVFEGGSHDLLTHFGEQRRELDRWLDLYVRDRRPPDRNGVRSISGTLLR